MSARAPMVQKKLSDYVMCRMNPFRGSGKGSIPDAGNFNFVVVDEMTYDNISFNTGFTGELIIQTMPTLPCSAFITLTSPDQNGLVVNGVSVKASQSVTPPTYASTYYPLSILNPYKYSPGIAPGSYGGFAVNPYGANAARLVACGYKLTYTGPVNTCAGSITVTSNDTSMTYYSLVASDDPDSQNLVVLNPQMTTVLTPTNGTQMYSLNYNSNLTALNRESRTVRPEEGLLFIPKHKSKDFKIQPISEMAYGVVANITTGSNNHINVLSTDNLAGNFNYRGGITWFDNDWSGAQIRFSGINPDASFRWETIWCMEYNPAVGTVMQTVAIKSSPDRPGDINTAQIMTSNAPLATARPS
jgi:hypothetical protein